MSDVAAASPASVSSIDPPTIVLAGRVISVPELTPRQQRVIVPRLSSFSEYIVKVMDAGGAQEITGPQYDALCQICWAACTKTMPALTFEEFSDWPVSFREMISAVGVITRQCGLEAGDPEGPSKGEAAAGASLIGTT